MLCKEYGRTGKKISAVSFGGMRFAPAATKEGRLEECAAVVIKAHEMGVNYFDTAPGYCHDKSEEVFGLAFSQMKGEYYVSTKCGLWMAHSADDVRKIIDRSLKRLGREKIDFFHVWCLRSMEDYEKALQKGGLYEGILKAKQEGLVDHICMSTHMKSEDIAMVAADGVFDGVTLGYNAMNFAYRQEGINACHKAGMGVVVMNPLGGGLIPQFPDYFSFIRENEEDTLSQAAIKFIISQKQVTAVIAGMGTIEEVIENVKAAEHVQPMDDMKMEKMKTKIKAELNTLCTSCGYCDFCPVEVPIPKMMDSYNRTIIYNNNLRAGVMFMKGFWDIAHTEAQKCIACGKCEALCTQKLPIIQRLKEMAAYTPPEA